MSSISRIPVHFGSIPLDVRRQITSYFSLPMVATCAAVSKPFQTLMDEPRVWKGIAKKCNIELEGTNTAKLEVRKAMIDRIMGLIIDQDIKIRGEALSYPCALFKENILYEQLGYCYKAYSKELEDAHNKLIEKISKQNSILFEEIALLNFFAKNGIGLNEDKLIQCIYTAAGEFTSADGSRTTIDPSGAKFEAFRILVNHLVKYPNSISHLQDLLTNLCIDRENGEFLTLVLETGLAFPTEKDIWVAILNYDSRVLKILFSYRKFDKEQVRQFLSFCDFAFMLQVADISYVEKSQLRSENLAHIKKAISSMKEMIQAANTIDESEAKMAASDTCEGRRNGVRKLQKFVPDSREIRFDETESEQKQRLSLEATRARACTLQVAEASHVEKLKLRSEYLSHMKKAHSNIKEMIHSAANPTNESNTKMASEALPKIPNGILHTKYFQLDLSLVNRWVNALFEKSRDWLDNFHAALKEFFKYSNALSPQDKDLVLINLMTKLLRNFRDAKYPIQEPIILLANARKVTVEHLVTAMEMFLQQHVPYMSAIEIIHYRKNQIEADTVGHLFRCTSAENEKSALNVLASWEKERIASGKSCEDIRELKLIIHFRGSSPKLPCTIL